MKLLRLLPIQHSTLLTVLTIVHGIYLVPARAQDTGAGAPTRTPAQNARPPASSAAAIQADRERQLTESLTDAKFIGMFQVTNEEGLNGKAALTPPQKDTYHIQGINKLFDDNWMIKARIKYADKDVTIPVPVRVVWADDTPIITVDNAALPFLGTYSARVMVFRNFYAGTWFGDCYGGILSGQIVKAADADALPQPKTIKGKPVKNEDN